MSRAMQDEMTILRRLNGWSEKAVPDGLKLSQHHACPPKTLDQVYEGIRKQASFTGA